MNLEIFNNLIKGTKNNNIAQNFIKELSNYLKNETEGREHVELPDNKNNIEDLRQENCLYQVVDRSKNGVYLQNLNNNRIFEETNIPQELLDKIGNDYILRYKDGNYNFEEELTDQFFEEGLIDIDEINKQ